MTTNVSFMYGPNRFPALEITIRFDDTIKKPAPPNHLEFVIRFHKSIDLPTVPRNRKDQNSPLPTDLRPSLQLPKIVPADERSEIVQSTGAPQCNQILNAVKRLKRFFYPEKSIWLNRTADARNLRK